MNYVVGTSIGTGNIVENHIGYDLCPCGADILEKMKHQPIS